MPLLGALLLSVLLSVALEVGAQYQLDWVTINGGGGKSTGEAYSVSVTIGQSDAWQTVNTNITLKGGFWSVVAAEAYEYSPSSAGSLISIR